MSAQGNWVPAGRPRTRPNGAASGRRRVSGQLLVGIWRENWFQVDVGVSPDTSRFRSLVQ